MKTNKTKMAVQVQGTSTRQVKPTTQATANNAEQVKNVLQTHIQQEKETILFNVINNDTPIELLIESVEDICQLCRYVLVKQTAQLERACNIINGGEQGNAIDIIDEASDYIHDTSNTIEKISHTTAFLLSVFKSTQKINAYNSILRHL